MKRSIRVVVAATALVVAACGGTGGGGTGQSGQLGALNQKVTVQFWEAMAGGSLKPTLEKITNDFNSSQKNVTVQLQVYPDYNTLNTKTLAALAAGNPPDLAQCYENWAAKYNQSHALADMAPYINAKDGLSQSQLSDYFPVFLSDGKLSGKQYMLPFNKSDYVLYYNDDLFKQAGLTGPPKSWEEFFTDAQKLTGNGHWGTDNSNSMELIFEEMLMDYGGSLLSSDQSKAAFNSDTGAKVLQMWKDGIANGSVHTISGYDDADFGAGKEAMSIGTIAGYSFKQQAVAGKFTMKTAVQPSGPSGAHALIQGTNVCIFSHSSQAVQQGAFQYVKFVTSKSETEYWSENTGYMPVLQSAYKDMQTSFYSSNPILLAAPQELPTAVFDPSLATWNEAIGDISTEVENALAGKKSPKQALDDAANQVNTVLAGG
ncbi:MAG TPA: ABC transporter substrate-binding protein [Candidatus Dormibacteraeota bacterium]|nr:ABC transporter substrate-binding protein [Candidatus Dormibacteraeota bacterium]